ncbi:undecaprenyldiphospho-muramoylpentapeptide beta-N-acetylglucosaminyltransferase [uncultured Treponema sp.]|uniref:undecaprenyldiphospho-muramoylpentapeptide beta-N-acetylglucosaminyltransferase n=1 Tax=uncultured Treponema sp. TaxID=162155 RepID=UPI002588BCDB|nr:undecaprenyldiphospho-muramoylpentapeptide beta-N-acetylglucosaminyltransferase [uncultured Treponema sp.]
MKIVFAGGGTGGHIYPGLAVADELKKIAEKNNLKIKIYWFGNSSGMDRTLVEKSGSADMFCAIPSGKLRRYFSIKNFFDVFKIIAGIVVSFFRLLFIRPAVVFSKGGFVSVPPCFAARVLRIPVFTHECDFTPGLATKINSRFASKILVSYPETVKFLPKNKQSLAVVTGNPVRPVFYEADAQKGRKFLFEGKNVDLKKPVLLVLGGSLGAHQLNELVVENLAWLTDHFNVVHQCGSKDAGFVPAQTDSYFPYPFIYEQMPDVIACADVILSRAGANTVWESAVEKKPSVLIPLCGNGTRGDQVDNANFFKERGAAFVLTGNEAVFENLRNCLEKLLDKKERDLMSQKMAELASGKRASLKIAELIFKSIESTIKITSV